MRGKSKNCNDFMKFYMRAKKKVKNTSNRAF